jgi:hypothetical protein
MHAIIKKAALAAALATASLSAHALETKITVYADVDPTLALLRDDGTPLPDTVQLTHDPLRGLLPSTQQVRIHSNDETADIEVRLGHDPVLLNGATRAAGRQPEHRRADPRSPSSRRLTCSTAPARRRVPPSRCR